MKRTIISHDPATAIATIRFEHKDVTYEDTFNLKMVIPGADRVFADMGLPFDEDAQNRVIDKLTEKVQMGIEDGAIMASPPVEDG